jgi:hypothetical protein
MLALPLLALNGVMSSAAASAVRHLTYRDLQVQVLGYVESRTPLMSELVAAVVSHG